jgi:hypothetical protein
MSSANALSSGTDILKMGLNKILDKMPRDTMLTSPIQPQNYVLKNS